LVKIRESSPSRHARRLFLCKRCELSDLAEQVLEEVERKPKGPGGRPSLYTEAMVSKVIAYFTGGGSYHGLDRKKELPAYGTVVLWGEKYEEFSTRLARARAAGAAKRFDAAVDRTWDATDRDTSLSARVALMGAEAQAKAMNPTIYNPVARQELSVSVGIVGVLEVVEERRRALEQAARDKAKVIEHADIGQSGRSSGQ
jgi:hypothetical protein